MHEAVNCSVRTSACSLQANGRKRKASVHFETSQKREPMSAEKKGKSAVLGIPKQGASVCRSSPGGDTTAAA